MVTEEPRYKVAGRAMFELEQESLQLCFGRCSEKGTGFGGTAQLRGDCTRTLRMNKYTVGEQCDCFATTVTGHVVHFLL